LKVYQFLTKYKWTQGAFARDDKDYVVDQFGKFAKKFCVIGAICRIYRTSKLIRENMIKVQNKIGGEIGEWNDNSEYSDIIKVLKGLDI